MKKKKDCSTVIRIQTYEEIKIKTQKPSEPFRVSAVKPANIPSGQQISIKQFDTAPRRFLLNKKVVFLASAVLAVSLSIPFLFAAAASSNQVSGQQAVNPPAATPAVTSTPVASGGELVTDLTESTTLAAPSPSPLALTVANTSLPVPSASATPLDVDAGYTELSSGMTDPFVAMIQQRLMDLYYLDQDDPTPLYGPVTKQAVTDFQRLNGLKKTGIADVDTQALLFSPAANPYIVKPGDSSPDVETIQERLAELGYTVEVNGTYGDDTQKAIQAFQKINSLEVDGNVGNDTRQALYSSKAKNASSAPAKSNKSASVAIAPADPNKVEALINAAMAQLGKPYVLGGKGPNHFDCSGLVYYALKSSGNGIGYMTSYDWADAGEYQRIGSMKDLQRGDIVCESGHVGIYLGDGHVVNASSSNGNIIVSQDIFSSPYWVDHFICGRRPF